MLVPKIAVRLTLDEWKSTTKGRADAWGAIPAQQGSV
jgi:hypothetical protein